MVRMPPPKFATQRDPAYRSRGPDQAVFARRLLGSPFMPWQYLVADVAGEITDAGLPRYPLVVVTVQRQAGKSHLAMARKGERCFRVPGYRAWYTAQTGGDARDQFLKFGEQVAGSPLGSLRVRRGGILVPAVRTLVGNGREVMHFANGSELRPHPPTPKALHGKQGDDNDVDEGWAFTAEQGRELLQAIGPTQLTRPGAQTWIVSAGGTAESTWLAELVARGREGDPGLAYFEWGIPDDADAEDLDVIAAHHPAYGHTVTLDSLRSLRVQFGDDSAGWARAAGNRWSEVIGGAISAREWAAVRYPDPVPEGGRVGYGAARTPDGTQTGIAAAVALDDGRVVVEIVEVLNGVTARAAAARAREWATDGPVAVTPDGPSAPIALDLSKSWERRYLPTPTRDYSAACANLLDGIRTRTVLFRPHPDLDAAVAVLASRAVGDGGFVWSRKTAAAPVATAEAATLAVHALAHGRKSPGRPRIITAA